MFDPDAEEKAEKNRQRLARHQTLRKSQTGFEARGSLDDGDGKAEQPPPPQQHYARTRGMRNTMAIVPRATANPADVVINMICEIDEDTRALDESDTTVSKV